MGNSCVFSNSLTYRFRLVDYVAWTRSMGADCYHLADFIRSVMKCDEAHLALIIEEKLGQVYGGDPLQSKSRVTRLGFTFWRKHGQMRVVFTEYMDKS